MINRIKSLFLDGDGGTGGEKSGHRADELHVAAAALLVEAACLDDHFHDDERARIEALLRTRFELTAEETATLLKEAERAAHESGQLHGFARIIREHFDHAERVGLIEMLWQVAYADGVVHDYEASLLRRLTGLIYVSDRESGEARKRVLAEIGLEVASAG